MSDNVEEVASNDPNSPERERSRSPPPPPQPQPEADTEVSRRTCPVCSRLFDSAKAMWGHSWVHRERRDQIYAMDPPASAPPPVNGGGAVVVASGSGSGSGGGGVPWHPWKIDSMELRDRTCPRCSKVFGSPKAMFGHLHVHYEKPGPRRGRADAAPAAPAPALEPAPAEEPVQEGGDSPVGSIDLNRPVPEAEEEEAQEEQDDDQVDDGDSSTLFDLNLTPPSS